MFKKQYFSILLWKSLVYIMGVFSLLIVTPTLTDQPKIFGIYSFCASLIVFFSYADLGFITSSRKFASEYVAKKKQKAEIAVTSFSSLVLLLICLPISGIILFFSFRPNIIISDLVSRSEYLISSNLLLILACSFPILVLQRIVQIIYSVRLKDAFVYRLEIFAIFLRIISVLYFFSDGKYMIVEFFLFSNVVTFISLVILVVIAYRRFDYNWLFFIKCLRFRKTIYQKVSKLAFASLFVSISWLLFYEIDIFLITTINGALMAAYYAVAFNIINILRNLLGTVYYPFVVKFNYMVTESKSAMKEFIYRVLKFGNYIILPGILTLICFSEPIIVSWLGNKYLNSIIILQLLFTSYIFYPLNTLAGSVQTVLMNVRLLYIISGTQLLIQYLGLFMVFKFFDANLSLAAIKIFCGLATSVILILWLSNYFSMNWGKLIKSFFLPPIIVSTIFLIPMYKFIDNIAIQKSLVYLFSFTAAMIIMYLLILVCLAFFDKQFKMQVISII